MHYPREAKPRAGRGTEMELASPSSPPPPDALGHPSVTFVDSRSCGRVKLFVGGPDRFLGHEGGDPRNALREVRLRRSDGDERPSHGEGKGVGLRPVCGPGSPERSLKVKDTDPVIDGRMVGDSSCILIVGKGKF